MPSSSQYFCFVPKYLPLSAAPPDRCRHDHTKASGSVYSCDGHLRAAWSPHLLPQHHQLLGAVLNPDFWGYNLHTGQGSPINCTVLSFPTNSGLCGRHCLKDSKTKGFYHSPSLPRAPLRSAPSSTLRLSHDGPLFFPYAVACPRKLHTWHRAACRLCVWLFSPNILVCIARG